MDPVGKLIASGRSADIYEAGDGRVLRRSRKGQIPTAEAVIMRAVRDAGFPVPAVHSVDGADMVMERLDGVDLLTRLSRRPWQARRIGTLLADLHRRLATIPITVIDLPTTDESEVREAFVHGDLHPGNVMLTEQGPVVIDWEGASIGPSDADVATTWLVLETADADDVSPFVRPLVGLIRRSVLRAFLRGVMAPRPATIAAICEERLHDPNMRPHELERIRAFAARNTR